MLPDFALTDPQLKTLKSGRWIYASDNAVFHLSGPGTIDCIQGVLTNDIVKAGPQALVWGALLTPKGMIITDLWVKRDDSSAWLIVPRSARDTVKQLLARSFPPRLTKAVDKTDEMQAHWLVAPNVADVTDVSGVILPHEIAPFTAMLIAKKEGELSPIPDLLANGWESVGVNFADALKYSEMWPTLGREIDDKTLVQEVRFDELKGVKYDKGCYTGQETVARLHFRGHANWELRQHFLVGPPSNAEIAIDGKLVGHITTWGILGEECVALAMMKKNS